MGKRKEKTLEAWVSRNCKITFIKESATTLYQVTAAIAGPETLPLHPVGEPDPADTFSQRGTERE